MSEVEIATRGGVSWFEIAASAYRAYAASTGNKNFRGDPMPRYEDLPTPIQEAWQAAVMQAIFFYDHYPIIDANSLNNAENYWCTAIRENKG